MSVIILHVRGPSHGLFKTDIKEIGVPAHRKRFFAQRRKWAAAQGVSEKLVQKIYQAIVDESKRVHLAGLRARKHG